MTAKYPGQCPLCPEPIEVGDEIARGNGQRRHTSFAHARCVPSAGVVTRAGFVAVVTIADERGWIPVGTRKQYVREAMANAVASQWRNLGATVEVRKVESVTQPSQPRKGTK